MSREVVEKSGLKARLFSRERVERSERGDTLIEVLLALIVLGLTSVALIVAFSTTISASAQHRRLASADIAINDYSQQVIAGIEANQNLFTCSPALSVSQYISELQIPSPAPYSPTITNVQYWSPSPPPYPTSCIANDSELITVSVNSGSKNQTMQFVVDSPTSGSNYVGGAPTGLAFTTPTAAISAISGASLPVNPVVEVLFGNSPDATDLSPINLTLGDPSGIATSAGTLSGCSSNDLNGFVTYTGCTISLTTASTQAVYFTLVATLGNHTVTSPLIAVSGSTSSFLSFTTQPQAGYSGSIMNTQPVVTAYLGGTTSTVDTTVMSITLTTSGSLSGSYQLSSCSGTTGNSTTTESNGVVTITDSAGNGGTFVVTGCDFAGQFYYDSNSGAVGTPYTMTASSPNVTSATSQPFAATGYGAASRMEFIAEPTGGIASSTSGTTATMNSFQVAIEDSWGNTLSGQGQPPYAGSISVTITGGSTLSCTESSSEGIFTFTGCSASLGSNLKLTATATGTGSTNVTPEPSSVFNNSGPVFALVWYAGYPSVGSSPQPVAGASGSVMTNQPVLAYEDAGLNSGEAGVPEVVTADTTSVSYTSSYASGTQSSVSPNGVLTTCSNLPPIGGIISAGNCTFVGLVGTNYTMKATTTSGTTITSLNSSPFSPTGPGPASQLAFAPSPGVEPVAAAAGSPFTTEPVVVVEDAGGNIVALASTQVEMNSYLYDSSHPTNPSVQGGSLLNCSTLAPVLGAVSLIPVSGYLDVEGSCAFGGTVGTSYQLVATAPGLASAVSTTFTPTTFGPASAIAVSGCSPGVKWKNTCVLSAAVQDAWGNIVTSFNTGITFADVGGSGTVSGLGTSTASGGVANITVTGTFVGPELVTAAEGALTSPQYSFNVIADTTTATVSETPTSVVYSHESTAVFTVTVVTGNHEILPTTDNVTLNVGSTSCIAAVAPSGTGGTGTCSISNTALPASTTAYAVTAAYPGDTQLQVSALATAATGLTVTNDATTTTVSETPTSVTYGHESSSIFTVNVVTGNHELLPSTDNVTVNVGTASCVAAVAPAGTGGIGTCSIANSALPASTTAYAVTATYPGDIDLSASTPATAPTGLTVTKDTTAVVVSESPTSVSYGNEGASVFTVDVNPSHGENLPAVENVTVNVGATSCVAAVAVTTIGTCSIANSALPASTTAYIVTATYSGDTDLSGSATATAATGLTVTKDTSSATVSETPTAVTYNAEATSVFTVDVNPSHGENLPAVENVTVNVGATSCVAAVAVTTIGTCSIANSALPASTTAYIVTATYSGDTDLSGSATATAATGLTVTKAAPPAITWANPASISYGTQLSATQLSATDTLAGTFVYSPASGALLTVGSHTLGVTFTPTDITDYTTATKNVTLTVSQDTSAVTVSETPTSVTYGSEASSVFTVNVNPTNGENLPAVENVTVNVGSTSCIAAVAVTTVGTCTIASYALPASGTAYVVTATYPGDVDIAASATATATTGLTVNKFTPTITVTNTTNPTGIGVGNLVLTATVGGTGTTGPTGTVTWTFKINGTTSSTCTTTALSQGSGTSTAACTIVTPSAGTYTTTAAYGGDTNYGSATTPSTFGMYIGGTSPPDVPPGPEYYTVNSATSTGSATNTANTISPGTAETLTSITMTFSGGASSGANQTVTVGKITSGAYSATAMTCTVPLNTVETCASSGSVPIPSGSTINMAAIGNNLHTDFWIVTYTNP